jgi:hypothetical protein
MSNLRDGDRLVLYPRWAVGKRLPVAERTELTPTPKQMLYGQRAELIGLVTTARDAAGGVTAALAEVELKESRGSPDGVPGRTPSPARSAASGRRRAFLCRAGGAAGQPRWRPRNWRELQADGADGVFNNDRRWLVCAESQRG